MGKDIFEGRRVFDFCLDEGHGRTCVNILYLCKCAGIFWSL